MVSSCRKAVKATAVLFPLLGMTNVCFFLKPYNRESEIVYRVTNAALQSVQVSMCPFFLSSLERWQTSLLKQYLFLCRVFSCP